MNPEKLRKIRTIGTRVGSFGAGVVILYHEVFITASSEPLLVFLGLWFCGIAPASFFDGLRKMTEHAKEEVDKTVSVLDESAPKLKEE